MLFILKKKWWHCLLYSLCYILRMCPPAALWWQQMMRFWKTLRAVSGQRQREFQEFPPDVRLPCLKPPDIESGIRVKFLLLNWILNSIVCWPISKNINSYFLTFMNPNFSLRPPVGWMKKELCRLEANSAFPLASALPSLTFCFLTPTPVWDMIECASGSECTHVCVCVRERVYPVLPRMWRHRKKAGLC